MTLRFNLARFAILAMLMAAALAGLSSHAQAERLVLTLSDETVKISSNFTGEQITIFGAIEADEVTVPRSMPYDVVITISGPARSVVARKKERVYGIWINRESQIFPNLPAFFTTMASKSLGDIAFPITQERLILTPRSALNPTLNVITGADVERMSLFSGALLRIQHDNDLYHVNEKGVEFVGDRLFKAQLQLPANAPVGNYEVYAHLFTDNALLATRFDRFRVVKTGFEQFAYDMAQDQPALYGLIVVLVALLTGWVGGVVFRRS
jgi:uncharacterized protein (TIGR02186 family)